MLQVDLNDAAGAQNTISSALQSDPDIDGILALGPTGAAPALAAVQDVGSDAQLATFDLSPEVLDAIEAGEMAFAVDQQQYIQGYLPIVFLTLYRRNLTPSVAACRSSPGRGSSRRRTRPRSRSSRPPAPGDLITDGRWRGRRAGHRDSQHGPAVRPDTGGTTMGTLTWRS